MPTFNLPLWPNLQTTPPLDHGPGTTQSFLKASQISPYTDLEVDTLTELSRQSTLPPLVPVILSRSHPLSAITSYSQSIQPSPHSDSEPVQIKNAKSYPNQKSTAYSHLSSVSSSIQFKKLPQSSTSSNLRSFRSPQLQSFSPKQGSVDSFLDDTSFSDMASALHQDQFSSRSSSMWDMHQPKSPKSTTSHTRRQPQYSPTSNCSCSLDSGQHSAHQNGLCLPVSEIARRTSVASDAVLPGGQSTGGGPSSYSSVASEQSSFSSNSLFSSTPQNDSFPAAATTSRQDEYAVGAALFNQPASSRTIHMPVPSSGVSVFHRGPTFDLENGSLLPQQFLNNAPFSESSSNLRFSPLPSNPSHSFISANGSPLFPSVLDKFPNLGQSTRDAELISLGMKGLDLNLEKTFSSDQTSYSVPPSRQGSVSSNFFPSPSIAPASSDVYPIPSYRRSNSIATGSIWNHAPISSTSVSTLGSPPQSSAVIYSPISPGFTDHTSGNNNQQYPNLAPSSYYASVFSSPANSVTGLSDCWSASENEYSFKSPSLVSQLDGTFTPLQSRTPPTRPLSRLSNAGNNGDRNLRQHLAHIQQQQLQIQPQTQDHGQSQVQAVSPTPVAYKFGSPKHFLPQSGFQSDFANGVNNSLKPDFNSRFSSNSFVGRKSSDASSSLRSYFLEEFRSNKTRKFELRDIYGHVVELSGDQYGSRFIQQRLENASSEEKEIVFEELKSNSLQLMTDVFGNYVIQKFFELGNQLQKTYLAKQMEGHMLNLSLQMYGCRVVQKALEHVLTAQQAKLIKELDGHVVHCVKDQNGNHVIQKAVERMPAKHIEFIFDAFHSEVFNLATHPYGCRVIQRMLEHCEEDSRRSILTELHCFTCHLVEDQYGNYVVQHVIERGNDSDREQVITIVKSSILSYSRHKFASNVVEKCITYGTSAQRDSIIKEILKPRSDGIVPMNVMMKDQFANYVIQKLLSATKGEQHDNLVNAIKPHLDQLKKFTYGKHLASIEKLISQSEMARSQA